MIKVDKLWVNVCVYIQCVYSLCVYTGCMCIYGMCLCIYSLFVYAVYRMIFLLVFLSLSLFNEDMFGAGEELAN